MKNFMLYIRVAFGNAMARINRFLAHLLSLAGISVVSARTALEVLHIRNGKTIKRRLVLDKCITDAFVNLVVDAMQGNSTAVTALQAFKYHGTGTGTTAEAATQTALVTEVGTRVTGTQAEGNANQYKSVATITYSGTYAITEHGLFSASTAGTLADRTLFPVINVINGDSVQFTFTMSFTAGG